MKNKIINIKKDILKRKKFTKIEIKKILLKSIIQNKNIKPLIRIKAVRKNCKYSYLSYISKQNNNICLKTGRIKGVYNMFNISRHSIKKISVMGNLQNIKIASW
jgi:ribosomal protein S14